MNASFASSDYEYLLTADEIQTAFTGTGLIQSLAVQLFGAAGSLNYSGTANFNVYMANVSFTELTPSYPGTTHT
jgi:hypothetical protein